MKAHRTTVFKAIIFTALSSFSISQAHAEIHVSGLPNAQAGQCFAKVKVPAKYKTQKRQIILSEATTQRVLVKPAQYRWVDKKVLTQKSRLLKQYKPAEYKKTIKRVMVKPATEVWKEGHGVITRIDNMTGQIMCRVRVPAVYKNVEQKILIQPAKTIQKVIPAVYKTVKTKVRISPDQYKTIHIPARYKTQNYRVKVSDIKYIWRPILCATNSNKSLVKKVPHKAIKPITRKSKVKPKVRKFSKERIESIQTALKNKGFYPDEIDGQMGLTTVSAIKVFQKSRGLPPTGRMTKDTFRALGLIR